MAADISRIFTERHAGASATPTAITTSYKSVDFGGKDDKTALIFTGGGSDVTITVEAGTGLQGVSDITFSVPANKVTVVRLDSGEFKHTSGTYKGYIRVKGSASGATLVCAELVE